jgi:hypothetical protein
VREVHGRLIEPRLTVEVLQSEDAALLVARDVERLEGGPACGNNDEWWTYHHDEWNTGDYGADTRPPDRIVTLVATADAGSVDVTWSAPGDDGACGIAAAYELRWSDAPLYEENFASANPLAIASPGAAGTAESFTVPLAAAYVGVRAIDDAGNRGRVAAAAPGVGLLPEPGAGAGLLAGIGLLVALRASRRRG